MSIRLRHASEPVRRWLLLISGGILVLGAVIAYFFVEGGLGRGAGRFSRVREYWADPQAHRDWAIEAGDRCAGAPFLYPTSGVIGFLWGDSFRPGHKHQGLDIFGPSGPDGLGETRVVAAYDGYLTRLPEWRSAVIIRHPQDPLQPGRQIWTFYTHMADEQGNSFIDEAFPAGTSEAYVRAGTLLGYQGNFSGDATSPTGMHLHFSIVLDDGQGRFRNELEIKNTLDPTPYLGFAVNADEVDGPPPTCPA